MTLDQLKTLIWCRTPVASDLARSRVAKIGHDLHLVAIGYEAVTSRPLYTEPPRGSASAMPSFSATVVSGCHSLGAIATPSISSPPLSGAIRICMSVPL